MDHTPTLYTTSEALTKEGRGGTLSAPATLCRDADGAVLHMAFAMEGGSPLTPLALDQSKAPGEIMLFPAEPIISARDGRRFSLDIPAILAAFAAHEGLLPIDLEHASEIHAPNGNPAPAVGWINDVFERGGAVWARVTWTDQGRDLLERQAYRYISPAFGAYEDKATGTGRVVRLYSAGLTNKPALKLPLLAREQGLPSAKSTSKEPSMDLAQKLREVLGLAADASPEVILQTCSAKVEEAKTVTTHLARADAAEKAVTDLTRFVPRQQYDQVQTQLASFQQAQLAKEEADKETRIDALWSEAVGAKKVVPAQKDWFVQTCRAQGVEHMKTFLAGAPVVAPTGASDIPAQVKAADGKLDDGASQMCRMLGIAPDAFVKTLKEEAA